MANIDQTKMGRRPQVIPGARMKMIVTRKFRPPRMEVRPNVMMARLKRICALLVTDGERRVGRPAGLDAAEERRRQEHDGDRRDEPEGERVEPGECHVVGADHERDGVVADAADDRSDRHGDHEDAVEAHGAVVLPVAEELDAALGELERA